MCVCEVTVTYKSSEDSVLQRRVGEGDMKVITDHGHGGRRCFNQAPLSDDPLSFSLGSVSGLLALHSRLLAYLSPITHLRSPVPLSGFHSSVWTISS